MDARISQEFFEMAVIHLPKQNSPGSKGRRPWIDHYVVLKIIWFVEVTGCRWKDVPKEMGCNAIIESLVKLFAIRHIERSKTMSESSTAPHVKLFRVSSNTKSASLSLVPLTGCNCFLPCSRALRISSGPCIATRCGMSVP